MMDIGVFWRLGFDSVRTSQTLTVRQKQGNEDAPQGVYRQPVVYPCGSMSANADCMKAFPIYILRGAFDVARFDEQGNAKAFTLWNGQQDWLHVFYVHRCRTDY